MAAALARCTLPPTPAPPPESDHRARMEGVVLDRFEDDRRVSTSHFDRADVDRETGVVRGERATVRVMGESAEVRATITAPKAEADLRAREVRMLGGVRLVDDEGRVMTTEAMRYRSEGDRLESESAVTLTGDNFTVEGSRLTGQPRTGALKLQGPVRARVRP